MPPSNKPHPTPVDDLRRVRERLSREAGGNIAKIAEQADRVAESLRKKIGFKKAKPANAKDHREGPKG